ncbi:hypothetical protein CCACVL1_18922 [Corchorus capsularis]|uniref:Bromodomain associated domain-containing protein n=1 Tax=Corchorus capsularis TaxID=210143 RepID=A0A1R3HJG0_COCAP|nr:hypothetical protein CCACVL1_18922 [Corchorus capsularis]
MNKPKKSKRKSNTLQVESTKATSTPGDFSFSITKVAVSQICKSVGFRRSQVSALETLTLVATKYLEALGKSAASFANAAGGRTQSNLFDLTNALHDLSFQTGFLGASTLYDSSCCLLKSSLLEDLSGFVSSTVEIPFAKPIERSSEGYREEVKASSSSSPGELQRGCHVPEWLPGFPDLGSNEECNKKRVNGEELWENSSSVLGCQTQSNGFEVKTKGKLAKKRTRVKFRINGGVKREHLNRYRGNVCFNSSNDEDAEAESEKPVKSKEAQNQILVYKRRKLKNV